MREACTKLVLRVARGGGGAVRRQHACAQPSGFRSATEVASVRAGITRLTTGCKELDEVIGASVRARGPLTDERRRRRRRRSAFYHRGLRRVPDGENAAVHDAGRHGAAWQGRVRARLGAPRCALLSDASLLRTVQRRRRRQRSVTSASTLIGTTLASAAPRCRTRPLAQCCGSTRRAHSGRSAFAKSPRRSSGSRATRCWTTSSWRGMSVRLCARAR